MKARVKIKYIESESADCVAANLTDIKEYAAKGSNLTNRHEHKPQVVVEIVEVLE
jgi:hypothetical protein